MASPNVTPDLEFGTEEEYAKLFHVVLLDDDDHTYDYVIEMLQRLFAMSSQQAYQHAVEVDQTGRTVVLTCEYEPALFAKGQIQGYGADPRMPRSKGSMSAIVEEAAG
ncbi:MAG: ATP-dependent Clp protease adaptor ClpS [Bryobacter sp.]|jgi:ATP-dependent Clp protease adaptor protein ClpS|nr:ATP-dependent Clp protease adaptor ClpS [Bryobacter sp.]